MDVLSSGHEQVVFCSDRESGLRAIIAIHSTALGPALGGTRFYPYASEEAAVADALRLSAAMTDKCALAGLPHGGGKTVVVQATREAFYERGESDYFRSCTRVIRPTLRLYDCPPE